MSVLEYSDADMHRWNWIRRNIHTCKYRNCRYVTKSMFRMINHLRRHWSLSTPFSCEGTLEAFYCKDCNFQTPWTMFMKKHIKEWHLTKPKRKQTSLAIHTYVCERCQFQTNFLLKLCKHELNECPQKRDDPSENANWYNYFKTVTLIEPVTKKSARQREVTYKCERCPYVSKTKATLYAHMSASHFQSNVDRSVRGRKLKWYQCESCPFKTRIKSISEEHNDLEHSEHVPTKRQDSPASQIRTRHRSKDKRNN